jgi:small-conductance mechanosensitive channel
MLAIDSSPQISDSVFHIAQTVLAFAVFLGAVAASRWGIRIFISDRRRTSHPSLRFYSSVFVVASVSLLLLRGLVEKLGTSIGSAISASRFSQGLAWLVTIFLGFYYVLILTSAFLLAILGVGSAHAFADRRIEAWQVRLRESTTSGETNPRFHAIRIIRMVNRLFRNALVIVLLLLYFGFGFSVFPRTKVISGALREILGPPLEDAIRAVENYLPKLGYLAVILLIGWVFLRAMRSIFSSIKNGTIVFESFPPDWVDPTYTLCRTVLLLFILMVSFPYLPGSDLPFFRSFSLFVGALVTIGSGGTIGNLLAGILLTYTRAFRVGEVVSVDGVYGKVIERTLLTTRVMTMGNEQVTIPNSKILTGAVTNYSAQGQGKGVAMTVTATIGYDVDWRTVHKLLIEGASRTKQIATDPAPKVLEQAFGNYSVEYHLRAWTNTSEGIFDTHADLRRNILDAFAEAGIEIMTPTILSHRDASELAVPTEQFPSRPQPRGIRITVDPLTPPDQ